jgi:glycine cleavage system regulatory protein
MSDTTNADRDWALANLDAYLAGGLEPAERERLQNIAAGDESVGAALGEARAADRLLADLFSDARPRPGLEDRIVDALRTAPGESPAEGSDDVRLSKGTTIPFPLKVAAGGVAALLLGAVGAVVQGPLSQGRPPWEGLKPTVGGSTRDSAPAHAPLPTKSGERGPARADYAVAPSAPPPSFGAEPAPEPSADEAAGGRQPGDAEADWADRARSEVEYKQAQNAPERLSRQPAGPVAPGASAPSEPAFQDGTDEKPKAREFFRPGDLVAAAPQPEAPDTPAEEPKPVAPKPAPPVDKPEPPPVVKRKVIRNGEMEFEVESFEKAVARVTEIASESGGFVGTVNSDKLGNGKVRGIVVVRCPPDNLDGLILKLRALGELKGQRISALDVTKQFTDLESQLRAARAVEERLLKVIADGKGSIKDVLEAEKQLGEWRTRIEKYEGELRYLASRVSLSTLTLTLSEKEIRQAASATEHETVSMGVETDDVEKAYQSALAAFADAKGRVTRSELKKHPGGQFSAVIHAEVPADGAGPLRDRLRQLGTVSRMDIDRRQTAEGGPGAAPDLRVRKGDAVFAVSLYNLSNVAPKETVVLGLAAADVEAVFKKAVAGIEAAGGRVVDSRLLRQKGDQVTGSLNFEVPAAASGKVLDDLKAAGEVVRLTVSENPDNANTTRTKRGFNVSVISLGMVRARETVVLSLAVPDPASAYRMLQEAAVKADGRLLDARLDEQNRRNVTGRLDLEIRRDAEPAFAAALTAAGDVISRNVQRAAEGENVVDSKLRLQVSLTAAAQIPPRETVTLAVEVEDPHKTADALAEFALEARGRVIDSQKSKDRTGRATARLVLSVPLSEAAELVAKAKDGRIVRSEQAARNDAVHDGKTAAARIEINLSDPVQILGADDGFWPQIVRGLSASVTALSWSLTVVIIGVCFVLPWATVIWLMVRAVKWARGGGRAVSDAAEPPGR